MKKTLRTAVIIVCALMIALMVTVYALFHGYFDRGLFEVKQATWSSSKEVAVVAKRSDHQALSGDQYFVLIGDHSFSTRELTHAYHSNAVIFSADSDCLKVHWEDSHKLVVTCHDGSIESTHIAVQQRRSGDVTVSYTNIPNLSR
ncbi:MAG: hypothetical protein ACJ71S_10405 [Acidobacteriaceae bacterium]